VDWIGLAQDRDKWRALLNVGVCPLLVPLQLHFLVRLYLSIGLHELLGNYRVAKRLVASGVVFSSIQLVYFDVSA
jgi:hypothetical protein